MLQSTELVDQKREHISGVGGGGGSGGDGGGAMINIFTLLPRNLKDPYGRVGK